MALNERGHELPDPTPVAVPVGFRTPPSLQEMIKTYIRRELSQAAGRNDMETFEEAEDFDIEDDPVDPHTPYEAVFDPPPEASAEPARAAAAAAGSPDSGAAAPPSGANGKAAQPPQAPSAGAS